MTDETQQTNTQLAQLGARLKATRETLQLTDKDAAARLHLSVKFITMMESGSYDSNLPTTFLRGYLRSYAKLLNMDENTISAVLEQTTTSYTPPAPTVPMQQVLLNTTSIKKTDRYIRWGTYVIVIALIGLVVTWWNSHSRYSVTDVPTPVTTTQVVPVEPNNTTTTETATAPAVATVIPNVTTASPAAPNTMTAPPTTAPLVPTAPALTPSTTDATAAATAPAATDTPPKKRRANTTKLPMLLHEPGLEGESDFN